MNKIKITVEGVVGSGKSTIAQVIERGLKAERLHNIIISDDDIPTMVHFHERVKELFMKDTEITIETKQNIRSL